MTTVEHALGEVDAAVPRRRRARHWSFDSSFALKAFLSIVLLVIVGVPVVRLAIGSFRSGGPIEGGPWTLQNYREALTAPNSRRLLLNTLLFSIGQTVFPVVVGSTLAWLVTRTNVPMRRLWEYLSVSLYFVPLLAAGTAWVILLGPQNGIINVVIRDLTPWGGLSVYSLPGMVLIQSFYLVPLVFLITAASFRSVNAELEGAARVSGASPWRTFFDVTLGVSRPAVASAALLCFIVGMGSLEIPLLFGFPARISVYTSQIYSALRVRFPPEYGLASALSMLLLVVSLLLLVAYLRVTRKAYRFVTVAGRSVAAPLDLGWTRWLAAAGCSIFFFFTVVLPFTAVIWGSLVPFIGAPSRKLWARHSLNNYREVAHNPVIWHALRNSLLLSVGAGIAVMVLGTLVAYVAIRTRSKWTTALEFGATLPLTIPAIVLATGLLFTYIQIRLPFGITPYGTLWIMALAYVAYFLPVALRQMSGAVIQVAEDLEHASRVAGAGQARTLIRIVFPLLLPAMFGGFLLAFITFVREFVTSVLLFSSGNEVVSVVMYSYYSNGRLPDVAVIAVVLSFMVFVLIGVAGRVFNFRISF